MQGSSSICKSLEWKCYWSAYWKAWCCHQCGDVRGWHTGERTILPSRLPRHTVHAIDPSLRCCFFSPSISPPETWPTPVEKKGGLKWRQMENCFWSKLLNIPFSFNKRTSRVIQRPGLLSAESCFAYRSQSCQTTAMVPTRKSMPFPPPVGSGGGASKSVF